MKQLGESGVRKQQKGTVSGQQTRRSMIARQENPPAINKPNIEDILALELSDTLINAAYNLAVTRITHAVRKMCDPTEAIFVKRKVWAFEGVRVYANRVGIVSYGSERKNNIEKVMESRQSILTHIDMLREERVIKERSNNEVILTKELQIEKFRTTIKKKLQRTCRILKMKLTKTLYSSFLTLQTYNPQNPLVKPQTKTSIQQTFQKYQQTRINQRHFHRRSIDKQPQRKSSNQLTYSLNKPYEYQYSRERSPERNQGSKNLLYVYGGNNNNNTDKKKASTCSQTQSNNSQKESESLSQEYYNAQTGKGTQGSSVLNRLKVTIPTNSSKNLQISNGVTKINDSRVSSLLMNGSYFAQGTKERELEILRNKYYRLVEEFKDFSERFLQVIKEE